MTAVLLAARFLLELALLAGLAIGGWRLADTVWAQLLLALALPIAAATLWGLVVAPKARVAASLPLRLTLEVLIFGSAALVLWATGLTAFAVVLLVLEAVVLIALLATGHPPGPSPTTTTIPVSHEGN